MGMKGGTLWFGYGFLGRLGSDLYAVGRSADAARWERALREGSLVLYWGLRVMAEGLGGMERPVGVAQEFAG
jgi:predicted ABC-type sugar transport system permease subunit